MQFVADTASWPVIFLVWERARGLRPQEKASTAHGFEPALVRAVENGGVGRGVEVSELKNLKEH